MSRKKPSNDYSIGESSVRRRRRRLLLFSSPKELRQSRMRGKKAVMKGSQSISGATCKVIDFGDGGSEFNVDISGTDLEAEPSEPHETMNVMPNH